MSTETKHYLSILALEVVHLVPFVIISIRKVLMSFAFVLVMLPQQNRFLHITVNDYLTAALQHKSVDLEEQRQRIKFGRGS